MKKLNRHQKRRKNKKDHNKIDQTLVYFWKSHHESIYPPFVLDWCKKQKKYKPKVQFHIIKREHNRRATPAEERDRRIRHLMQCAKGKYYNEEKYRDRKKEFNRIKIAISPFPSMCWVCQYNNATHRHHIIQLKNGGINEPYNIVPLCNNCHVFIHPHLLFKEDINEINKIDDEIIENHLKSIKFEIENV